MKWASRLTGGLRALVNRRRVEQNLDEELRQFVDASVEQKLAAGLSREDAVRRARAEAGSLAAAKDYVPTRREYLESLRLAKQRPRNETTLLEFAEETAAAAAAPEPSFDAKLGKTSAADPNDFLSGLGGDAPDCDQCGHTTVRNGACYKCLNCGNSMGCS